MKTPIINDIQCSIKNYLIQTRNSFRNFIKKETFELNDLIKFLKKFML